VKLSFNFFYFTEEKENIYIKKKNKIKMKNKYEIENILGITTCILGITAWIAFFIALYNNHIDI
jgi:hypothetical protein